MNMRERDGSVKGFGQYITAGICMVVVWLCVLIFLRLTESSLMSQPFFSLHN